MADQFDDGLFQARLQGSRRTGAERPVGEGADQFDDGLFRTRLHNSRVERPRMWPKSVSEMRIHTVYGDEAVRHHDPGHRWAPLHADHFHSQGHGNGQSLCDCGARCKCGPGPGCKCDSSCACSPYYKKDDVFWQPRWVDNASPATGVWNPFSFAGPVYYDKAACMWRQVSARR